MIMYHSSLTPSDVMEYGMDNRETRTVTPFVPDAHDEVSDFRPRYSPAGRADPKAESAPAPAPKKGAAKKAPARKAAPAPQSETIAVVGEELPPA